ncbi:unnamed protein product [Mesocestoides corti]|uniref:Uncharacterized protein n=1 Tax=Mesocestoides corti TaxID=53468 RepID=A0A0R3U1A0_MESCO|nr:unnamed protein product [Mesocestoides corti]
MLPAGCLLGEVAAKQEVSGKAARSTGQKTLEQWSTKEENAICGISEVEKKLPFSLEPVGLVVDILEKSGSELMIGQ